MKSYYQIKFKVRFRPGSKGNMVASVPGWVKNVHFRLGMVNLAIPIKSFTPKPRKTYKVQITSITEGGGAVKVKEAT